MKNKLVISYISIMTLLLMFMLTTLAIKNNRVPPSRLDEIYAGTPHAQADEPAEEVSVNLRPVRHEPLIASDTRIVYEYYYADGFTERTDELSPDFLLGKTKTELERTLIDWDVLLFSENEVILRKTMTTNSNQHYILGVYEGYLAVFYAEETEGSNLKEITDTPVNALAPEEQVKLRAGILITGKENLIRALETYCS